MKTKIVKLKETTSANDFLRTEGHNYKADIVVATADYQSAGRGQGTNTWESEAGKNLLFSVLIHPDRVPIGRQFLLSMAGGNKKGEGVGGGKRESRGGAGSLKKKNKVR